MVGLPIPIRSGWSTISFAAWLVGFFLLLQLLLQRILQPLLDRGQVLGRGDVVGAVGLAARQREVLGHDAVDVDGVDAGLLEPLGEGDELGLPVELAPLDQAPRPREDARDRVRARLPPLLVLPVVPRHRPVRRLRLERLAVRRDQHRRHQAQGPEALRYDVGLHVAVVVCFFLVVSER